MAAPPNKTELVDDYPNPSTGVFKAGLGKFYDYVKGLLGATGNAAEARTALGAAPIDSPTFTTLARAPTEPSTENSTKIATTAWAKLGFAVLWSANGYIKLPDWLGGWVVEWGLGSGASGSTGVTFPLAFPTACRAAYATMAATASVSTILGCTINSISTTGMAVTRQYWNGTSLGGAGEAFYWLAIGN